MINMITLECENFKNNLEKLIADSNLNIGVVYYIMKDVSKEVEELYYQQINYELAKIQEEEKDNGQVKDS
jgi:cytochrome c oxidase assembly protein Cox11